MILNHWNREQQRNSLSDDATFTVYNSTISAIQVKLLITLFHKTLKATIKSITIMSATRKLAVKWPYLNDIIIITIIRLSYCVPNIRINLCNPHNDIARLLFSSSESPKIRK